jgi:hypothetical protein
MSRRPVTSTLEGVRRPTGEQHDLHAINQLIDHDHELQQTGRILREQVGGKGRIRDQLARGWRRR